MATQAETNHQHVTGE